ncbi:MAG TPA: DUF1801 domain-containing protein [Candidatus Cybelea sp.]|nr:DUF1801 domain-containing protein [Candidatus Cybelea sp.]
MTKLKAKPKSTTVRPHEGAVDGFPDPEVGAVFRAYPAGIRTKLLSLRRLIFETAAATPGVGSIQEALKWGQPSYLTPETGSGSTIRIDRVKPSPGAIEPERYAVYFHCQTNLVETFRELYPRELTFGGNRSILFDADQDVPRAALCHCIALALTYHARRTRRYL